MKTTVAGMALLVVAPLWANPAAAWYSANRYGGSTSHAWGVGTEHTNAWGGSTAHAWGGGTEHTNAYGGSTYGEAGYGWGHTYPSGTSAYHPPAYGYAGYPAYHPPVAVPYYAAGGCYGCAAAAGAVAGVATGAAIASANTAAATSNAYAAGVAAGSAYSGGTYTMGVSYASLPAGCTSPPVQGGVYYLCGNTWFRPSYGANGVFYRVVPPP
jgi:hypothetical protein